MASQLNSQPRALTQPQGSPYCADPNCESCKELREMQERIRAENGVHKMGKEPGGINISTSPSRDAIPRNGTHY